MCMPVISKGLVGEDERQGGSGGLCSFGVGFIGRRWLNDESYQYKLVKVL